MLRQKSLPSGPDFSLEVPFDGLLTDGIADFLAVLQPEKGDTLGPVRFLDEIGSAGRALALAAALGAAGAAALPDDFFEKNPARGPAPTEPVAARPDGLAQAKIIASDIAAELTAFERFITDFASAQAAASPADFERFGEAPPDPAPVAKSPASSPEPAPTESLVSEPAPVPAAESELPAGYFFKGEKICTEVWPGEGAGSVASRIYEASGHTHGGASQAARLAEPDGSPVGGAINPGEKICAPERQGK